MDRRVALFGYAKLVPITALAVAFPFIAQRYQIGLVSNALILGLGAMALNVLMGLSGLVSAGTAALFAIGAYASAVLALKLGTPFPLTLVICGLVGAVVGFVVGLPALRVRGMYLAIATMALHFSVIFVLSRYQANEVGPIGFALPTARIGWWAVDTQFEWYFVILTITAASYWIIENLRYSRFGRAWLMLRDAPIAAASQGISLARFKLLAFVFSSAMISFSGSLFAYYNTNVYIEGFSLELAIQFIAMIVIGGWGSTAGSIAGAFFVSLMPVVLALVISILPQGWSVAALLSRHVADVQLMLYGGLIIGFLILEPAGLAGLGRRMMRWPRRWATGRPHGSVAS